MTFHLCVHGVDGDTSVEITTSQLSVIEEFLRREDHEGSDIELTIKFTGEEVYTFIDTNLTKEKENDQTKAEGKT